jgi:hypothetical protein
VNNLKKLSVEDKVSRAIKSNNEMNTLPEKVEKIIAENLEEALRSKIEFIKQKAEQINKVG